MREILVNYWNVMASWLKGSQFCWTAPFMERCPHTLWPDPDVQKYPASSFTSHSYKGIFKCPLPERALSASCQRQPCPKVKWWQFGGGSKGPAWKMDLAQGTQFTGQFFMATFPLKCMGTFLYSFHRFEWGWHRRAFRQMVLCVHWRRGWPLNFLSQAPKYIGQIPAMNHEHG